MKLSKRISLLALLLMCFGILGCQQLGFGYDLSVVNNWGWGSITITNVDRKPVVIKNIFLNNTISLETYYSREYEEIGKEHGWERKGKIFPKTLFTGETFNIPNGISLKNMNTNVVLVSIDTDWGTQTYQFK